MIEIEGVDHVEHHETVGSTNTLARRRVEAGRTGTCIWVADAQTAGRGRHGRSWHSPPARGNLYATLATPSRWSMNAVPRVTLAAGVALADAVATLGIATTLEWPNDLVIDGAKVAGILAEGVVRGDRLQTLIVGVGVNIGGDADDFPPELERRVTTLQQHSQVRLPMDTRWTLLRAWIDRLRPLRDTLESPADLTRQWRERAQLPAWVRLPDGREGEAVDIDASGRLRICVGDAELVIDSGALEWLR